MATNCGLAPVKHANSVNFVNSASGSSGRPQKGSDARRQTAKELFQTLGGAADTAPVLREFLQRDPQPNLNWCLLIFKALIRVSRVDGGI
jgi:hypothetical protein